MTKDKEEDHSRMVIFVFQEKEHFLVLGIKYNQAKIQNKMMIHKVGLPLLSNA